MANHTSNNPSGDDEEKRKRAADAARNRASRARTRKYVHRVDLWLTDQEQAVLEDRMRREGWIAARSARERADFPTDLAPKIAGQPHPAAPALTSAPTPTPPLALPAPIPDTPAPTVAPKPRSQPKAELNANHPTAETKPDAPTLQEEQKPKVKGGAKKRKKTKSPPPKQMGFDF